MEHRWWLCPNGTCEHGNVLHDVETMDDERPTCCVEGCPCGHDDLDVKAFEATGMFMDDIGALVDAEDALRLERLRAAGFCCQAGAVAHPNPCPWHDAPAPTS